MVVADQRSTQRSDPSVFRTLPELLRFRAQERPDETAYSFLLDGEAEAGHLTYGELDDQARAIGALLQQLGARGERVLLLYPPGLGYVAAFFGCLYAGAAAVPAYPPRQNRSLARLRAVPADARPRVALTTAAILSRVQGWLGEASELGSLAWETTDGLSPALADCWEEPPADAGSLAFLQYTSGSTGTPKGVMLSHGNLLHNLELMRRGFGFDADSRGVTWLPPYHDMGLIGGILQPLYAGFPVTLMSPASFLQRPFRWLQAISRTRATSSAAPNFAYDLCARRISEEERRELDLSCWRVAINGAEPVRPETLERFAAVFSPRGFRPEAFCPSFGLAEATLIVSGGSRSRPALVQALAAAGLERKRVEPPQGAGLVRRLVGCGQVLPGQTVRIVDPESLAPCPPGVVGEIWISGPSVAQGYWGRKEETESVFHATAAGLDEEWFLRTGDLGFLAGGELFVAGRLKDLIIIRGRNLHPQDIEFAVERSHPALASGSSAAFSVEMDDEERLVVVNEVSRGSGLDVEQVAGAIRRVVAEEFQVQVRDVVLVRTATIPKTTSGKIQRRACREAYLGGTLTVVGWSTVEADTDIGEAASLTRDELLLCSPTERSALLLAFLRQQAAQSLRIPLSRLAPDLQLSALGLDSLGALELRSRIEESLGVDLPLSALLAGATIADLTAAVLAGFAESPDSGRPEVWTASLEGEYPLSHGQQALWFLERLVPSSAVYNLAAALRVRGGLDEGALRAALCGLAAHHPALRTTVAGRQGTPFQRIRERLDPFFEEVDAVAWSDREVEARLTAVAIRPFDLEVGPPLRCLALRRGGEETVLLLVVHHLAADFWSVAVLLRDLGALYAAALAGTEAALEPLPCRFADLVLEERRMLAGERGERLWSFWRRELAGGTVDLELPGDRPRPALPTYAGGSRAFFLDPDLSDRLRTLARARGVTLHTALLAAFQALLGCCSGQEEFAVGCPTAGRRSVRTAGLVGYLVNPVPVRVDLQGDPTFVELLARVHQRALAAFEHADLPFPLLADRLQPARDPSRSPLFQVLCLLHRSHLPGTEGVIALALGQPGVPLELGPLRLETSGFLRRNADLDLTLAAAEFGNRLVGSLTYATDLFDAVTAGRLLERFRTLLAGAVENPGRPVLELPLLRAAERQAVLLEWNDTARALPLRGSLHELVEAQVSRSPDAVAVDFEGLQISYAELDRRAGRLACLLAALGVGPDTPVGVCVERSLEMVIALLATLKAGGAYLPLNPEDPRERLAFTLEGARAPVVLAQGHLLGLVEVALPACRPRVLCLDEPDGMPEADDREFPQVGEDHLAYVIYTSGSTGRPKGVMVPHGGIRNRLLWMQETYGLTAEDRVLQKTPYSFDVSVWEIFWPLLTGARLVMSVPGGHRDPVWLAGAIAAQGVSTIHFVPSMLRAFLREPGAAQCPSLRRVFCSGEVLPADLQEQAFAVLPGVELHNLYGPTEASVDVTFWACQRGDGRGSVPIGRPIINTALYVLDRRRGPVPTGVAGELHIGGAGLARGYLARPDLTAERFVPDPFGPPGARLYATGDLARFAPDGALEFLGRLDHQVKVRGFRIELGEIEATLLEHPGVDAAVVAARPDETSSVQLAAYLVPGAEAPSVGELRRFLGGKLPSYMVPAVFVFLESLPLTPSGKLDRKALPEPERDRSLWGGEDHQPPRTAEERLFSRIWAGVLGLERVGIRDNFFELGGDSILSLQVVARAGDEGLRITPRQMFQHQTVEELAAVAEAVEMLRAPVDLGSSKTPLAPIQRWFFEREQPNRDHYNQAVLLATRSGVRPDRLAAAIEYLVGYHDALRLRFARIGAEWTQAGSGAGPVPALSCLNLTSLPRELRRQALQDAANALQASLDIEHGPLLRAGFFELGGDDGERLLLVIHHLAVDGVSWRILLEDLERVCRRLEKDQEVALPPATPYRLWARTVAEKANTDDCEAEVSAWLESHRPPAQLLPPDGTGGPNTEGSVREVSVALGPEETRALLRDLPWVHSARVDEALLGALVRALAPPPGSPVRIDVETHGRDEAAGIDLSRAVGWFTAIAPVWLEAGEAGSSATVLRAVRDQVRPALERGNAIWRLRYLSPDPQLRARLHAVPDAEILFNYLGQLDRVLAGSALFAPADEPCGALRDGRGLRSHALEVEARVMGGKLHTAFRFSERLHSRSAIDQLADRFVRNLRELVLNLPEAGIEDIYPLSPTQEGLLFHSLYAPDSGVYVTQLACELWGELDLPAFERAWADLLARHPALRTSFSWHDGKEPFQRVHARLSVEIARLDWRGVDDGERDRIEELLQTDRERGFDAAIAPLMRLYLVRLAGERHLLAWSHHHLLLDGWSVATLVKELFVIYGARRQGRKPWLEPSRPYADFIAWLQAQDLMSTEAFWRGMFAGFSAPTPLGIDPVSAGAVTAGPLGAERSLALASHVTDGLRRVARRHRLTLSLLLQGAWSLLLSRYSGEEEVVFGATFSGRPPTLVGVEEMIGLFINTLPVRVAVPAGDRLLHWMAGLQALNVELRQYEHSPLVQVQRWAGQSPGTPLFDSVVVFENYPVDAALRQIVRRAAGLEVVAVRSLERTNYPLTIVGMPGPSLALRAIYDGRRFEGTAIDRLLGHLARLLESMAAVPDVPLADLPLLSGAEQHQVVVEWNAAAEAVLREEIIHRAFEAQVGRTPEAPAVCCGDETLTYRELDRRANRLAHRLRALGVGADVPVALCTERSAALVVGILGILKAGGAYVPLDPAYPEERLRFLVEDSQAPVLLLQRKLAGHLPAASARTMFLEDLEMPGLGERWRSDEAPCVPVLPGNAAYVIYTSGSTGRPKGVVVTHRNASRLFAVTRDFFGFGPDDVWTLFHSFAFDFSVWEIWGALLYGGRLVVVPYWVSRTPEAFYELLRRHGVTVLSQTPSAFAQLVRLEESAGGPAADLALRWVVFGGEALSVRSLETWWERHGEASPRLVNMYGITETTVHVTFRNLGWADLRDSHGSPIGRPLPDLTAHVLDAAGRPAPVGVPGELYVGGAGLARGYLGRPELTAQRFVPSPLPEPVGTPGQRLYRSGDLARRLPSGGLEYLGRIDGQVKIRGFRIEPEEIEAVLARHAGVREARVLVRGEGEERGLLAYVVPAGEPAPEMAELRSWAGRELPDHMVPAGFVFLDSLPLTPHGKVDRKALAAIDPAAQPEAVAAAPSTPAEELLTGLWAEVLGREAVGIHDDFFELGGHSLLATRLAARVRVAFGIDLPLQVLFASPTVAVLARELEERLAGERWRQMPPLTPVPRRGPAPLSFGQERLWFLEQLEPGTGAYNVPVALRIEGSLNVPALERSFDELLRRHEALRTAFPAGSEGRPVQVVQPPASFTLPVADLTGLPQGEAEALRLAVAEARRPLDLEWGPLFHVALLALAERDHVLLVTFHHAICDEWSMGLLVDELGACYGALGTGRQPQLPLPPVQLADHAIWQRAWMQGETLAAELGYWRERLRGAPTVLALPNDRPRPPVWRSRGATRRLSLPGDLAAALDRAARGSGATPFMLSLAAFHALLHRYTGQDDLVVGTPVANRGRLELEGLVGFLGNILMIRARCAAEDSFSDVLREVRRAVLEAHAHQDVPFEKLVEELHDGRDLSYQALFQTLFVMHNAPWRPQALGEASIRWIEVDPGVARFDWTFALEWREDGLAVSLEHATDLYDAATAQRALLHYANLLKGVAAGLESRIADLPLLGETEWHQLVNDWNDTSIASGSRPVHEHIAARAREHPSAVAVTFDGASLSRGELEARSNVLARHLVRLGVGSDVPVAVCLERSLDLLPSLLAVWKAGGAYVPLDPSYPRERLAHMLADSGAPVLLTQRSLAADLPAGAARVFCLDSDPTGTGTGEGLDPGVVVDAEQAAYVIYTSGSTGKPKGVQVLHGALTNFLDAMQTELALTPEDRLLAVTSLSFDIAGLELFLPLLVGAEVALCSRGMASDGALLRARLESGAVAAMQATPSTWRLLLDAGWRGDDRLKVLCGGETLDPVLAAHLAAAGGGFWNLYGPTETTIWSAFARLDGGTVTLGRPLANTGIHLLDRALAPVPIGVPGGLYIGGDGLARGYLGRPDLTAEKFLPDPFAGWPGARLYATGDLARRLPDGRLDFLGRLDHQVKIRGFRIELEEVEAALARHPGIKQAVVCPHPEGGSLVAYLIPAVAPALSAAELRENLKRHLPEHSVPSTFVMMEAFPLTPNGKVDRKALPAPDRMRPDLGAYTAPRTPAEEVLAGIFSFLLGVERVGVHDDFFLLGGHSLLAAQVAARVREAFRASLPLRRIFETPTVAGLAAVLERERALETEPPLPVFRDGDLPLSSNQERLWFLDQLDPGTPAYHLALALRIEGNLDRRALERALGEVADRHESLRTTFPAAGGRPMQVIAPSPNLPLPMVDLSGLKSAAAQPESLRLAAAEARRPFDLARGPLARALLLRLASAEHVLALTLHHIVSDGWSNQILIREALALYQAFHHGRPSPLSPLPFQYADYAVWQRRWLAAAEAAAQLAWWQGRLGDTPPALELPTDLPRPAVQTSRGGAVAVVLLEDVVGPLRAAIRTEGCTLFMSLLAAFQALLGRMAGQTDVTVGSPVVNRRWPSTEGIIGFFANTLVLRSDLGGDPTFRELLAQLREATLGAYDHADLPFEKLVEELAPVRDLSRAPLFQVLFALQNASVAALEQPGLALRPVELDPEVARFDLELSLEERDRTLTGALVFNRDLFDTATAYRLAGYLGSLLAAAAAEPSRRLSELPLLAAPERHALLWEWGIAGSGAADGLPVHRQFELVAATHPMAPALEQEGEVVSYGELNRWANRLAHRLRRLGVGPETRAALHAGRSAGLVAGLLGILKAGGAYVPLDPTLPRARLAFLLADCGAPVIVSESRWRDRLPTDAHPVVLIDGEDLAGESGEDPAVEVGPGDLAYVIYTSGSTGRPKGVLVEHGSLTHVLAASRREFGWDAADRMPVVAPFSFDIFLFELLNPLLVGGCSLLVELHPVLDLSRLIDILDRVTRLHAVPALMRQIVEAVREREAALGLRTLFVGGDTVPADLLTALRETFPVAEIRILYGPTEGTIICSSHPVPPREPAGQPLLGRPLEGTVLQIRDGAGALVPTGVAGEIFLAGPGVARGYLGREELTAERFPTIDGRRCYRTGDLARWLPDGTVEFLGRIDQQVKIRGFRIELGEIEAVLMEQPEVREAVVLARDGAGGDRWLVAYVVGEGPVLPSAAEFRARLAARLPAYMVPSAFVTLEALPLTPHSKVDRQALPVPVRIEDEVSPAAEGSRSPVEEILAGLWAGVLGVERVRRGDDFFALGGHSLLATRLASRVRDSFRVELSLRALLEDSTLAGQAIRIEVALKSGQETASPPLLRAARDGELPLSFPQERLWFLAQVDRGSVAFNIPAALRVRGALDPGVLARALTEIVRRHESLRTAFQSADGRPSQAVAPPMPVPLPVADVEGLISDLRNPEIRRLANEEARLPFDPTRPPLVRARLLRLGPEEHVVLFTIHHIVSDGWSMGVLVREVAALYEAFTAGRPSPLAELPIQYSDFAQWQRQWMKGQVLEAQLGHWRRQLAGAPDLLALPTDRPRPAVSTFRGAHHSAPLPADLSSELRALSRREGATLFMTLLAAFQALLHFLTGQEDIVVGTDVANRNRTELEELIGFFVNHLVIRTVFAGNPTFRELLQRVRESCLGAYAHQDLPFAHLVKELSPKRSLSHMPLFQALFVVQNAPAAGLRVGGLQFEAVAFDVETSRFDLAVFVSETGGGLAVDWNYSTELFNPSTIGRFARRWERLLREIVQQPDTRLDRIELVLHRGLYMYRGKEPKTVESKQRQESPFKKQNLRRQSVDLSGLSLVRSRSLLPDQLLPLLAEPVESEVDLAGWAETHRTDLDAWLATHGAVLFRGFGLGSVPEFERCAAAICPNLFADYGDLPRAQGGERVYRSTPYPSDKTILFHNESSHLDRWPLRQMLFCIEAAHSGGETPIVDCREIYRRLDPAVARRFEEKGLMYVRNFTDGLDVNWRDFFHTDDPATVEEACRRAGMAFEWREDGLITRQICSAVTAHPRTGEKIFFNQLQLHHPACLDANIRESLLALFPQERLPRNVYYGDGSPLEDKVVRELLDLYWQTSVSFLWQPGDLLLLDNMLIAHARNPFTGPRKIVVAMGDLFTYQAN
jgi:amino acid adenylation domain-containing protein/non-ribosomal peptide synthase protein (TIGR01720 family)